MATYKSLPEVDALDSIWINKDNAIVERDGELYRLSTKKIRKKEFHISITFTHLEEGTIVFTNAQGQQTSYPIYVSRFSHYNTASFLDSYLVTWDSSNSPSNIETFLRNIMVEFCDADVCLYVMINDTFKRACGVSTSFYLDEYGGLSFPLGTGFIRLSTNKKGGGVNEPS